MVDLSALEAEPPQRGPVASGDVRANSIASVFRQSRPASPLQKPNSSNGAPRFPIGAATNEFRHRFFPNASKSEWNDWRWQLRSRIRSPERLEQIFSLSDDERAAVSQRRGGLPMGITPYYASLMDRDDPRDALRRTHIPVGQELIQMPGEADDPLGEDHDAAVPGLVHRYPDRVLFLTTGTCYADNDRPGEGLSQ